MNATTTFVTGLLAFTLLLPAVDTRAADHSGSVELGTSHERLTKGLSAWESRYFSVRFSPSNDQFVFGGIRSTRRFDQSDREMHFGGSIALAEPLRLDLEAGSSDTHRVLPKHYESLSGNYRLGSGWVVGAGLRQSQFTDGGTRVYHVNLERYVADERFAYTVYHGGPDTADFSMSHRLQWSHSYSDTGWLGISLSRGRETEKIAPAGLIATPVRSAIISGQHPLSTAWHLTWEMGSSRQGDYYTRKGAGIGLRHLF